MVHYGYDNGGMLRHMSGTKGNDHYPYVDEIRYDKFGSRTHIAYGNGSYTNYSYEPDMRRLSRLETWDAGQNQMQDLTYTYDAANNITQLENSASAVSGMGGQYSYQFTYDALYRLTNALGNFDNHTFYYDLSMSYSPNGQILEKYLMADQSIAGINSPKQYNNAYNYTTGRNAPQEVVDQFTNNTIYLKWDSNGNLVHHDESELSRKLCWDEENRLTAVKDHKHMSAYLYDHAGERVWKMSGEVQTMTISGQTVIDHVALDRRTLYTNPYLIVTEAEYTKHYYAESQRIASKLGGGWAQAGYDPLQDHVAETPGFRYDNHFVEIVDGMDANALCVGIEPNNFRIIAQFNTIANQLTEDALEANQYFYHPDHLGSSSFITNASGNVDQHLQYLPFGEPWIDQRTSNNIRFTFSGKERDEETGYNYFGARYYNADISIWLSVDPLSDKFPSMTGYNYCFNNPIVLVDPDGRAPVPGDPVKNPRIAPSPRAGIKGGMMGNARINNDGTPRPHNGVDILAPKGTQIQSVTAGEVYTAGYSNTFGNYVIVKGQNASEEGGKYTYTLYAHLEEEGRASGIVAEGDVIGIQGNSGNAKGIAKEREHVHIEVSVGDDYKSSLKNRKDPLDYFDTKFNSEGTPIEPAPTRNIGNNTNPDKHQNYKE